MSSRGDATPRRLELARPLRQPRDQQAHAARLGMWLFLATEILLFAALFIGYAVYRFLFPEAFARGEPAPQPAAGDHQHRRAHHLVASPWRWRCTSRTRGKSRLAALLVLVTLAFAWRCSSSSRRFEYAHHFHEGALPGQVLRIRRELQLPGAACSSRSTSSTGLHALHVLIGMGVLAWVVLGAGGGSTTTTATRAVELGGMYWHLVDLVWIFLYPLLYLI